MLSDAHQSSISRTIILVEHPFPRSAEHMFDDLLRMTYASDTQKIIYVPQVNNELWSGKCFMLSNVPVMFFSIYGVLILKIIFRFLYHVKILCKLKCLFAFLFNISGIRNILMDRFSFIKCRPTIELDIILKTSFLNIF